MRRPNHNHTSQPQLLNFRIDHQPPTRNAPQPITTPENDRRPHTHHLDVPPEALHIIRRIAPIHAAPLARHQPTFERRVRPRHVAPRRRPQSPCALRAGARERPGTVLPEEVVQERLFCRARVWGRPRASSRGSSAGRSGDATRGRRNGVAVVRVVMVLLVLRGGVPCGDADRRHRGARGALVEGGGSRARGKAIRAPVCVCGPGSGGLVLRVVVVGRDAADAVDGLGGRGLCAAVCARVVCERRVLRCSV